jgi:hypothetical protein
MIEDQFFFRDVNSGFLGHAFVQLAVPFSKALDDGPFDIPGRRVCLFSGSRGGGSMPAPCNLSRKVKKEGFVV